MRSAALGLPALALLALTGCPPRATPPPDEHVALARINENLARIDRPLRCRGLISFRFRDAQDIDRRFIAYDAVLAFRPRQDLRLEVRQGLAGTVAEFGSNLERYWVGVIPEVRKLWWGEWRYVSARPGGRLPIPPDQLLDALLLRPLQPADGLIGPVLRVESRSEAGLFGPRETPDYRLLWLRLDEGGAPVVLRELLLDPQEPYQPLEIVDRLSDGRVAMRAELGGYARVGDGGPYTPRRYVIYWPVNQAEMRMDLTSAQFVPELPDEAFEFPAGWTGQVERVDFPAAPRRKEGEGS